MTIGCLSGESQGPPVMLTTSSAKRARNLVDISSKELARYWCKHLKKSKSELRLQLPRLATTPETVMKELNGDTAASTSKTLGEAWELWIADSEANGLEMSTVRPRRQLLTHWWAEACRTQHSPALSVR
jgi:hypothetical protein